MAFGGPYAAMPKELLDGAKISPTRQQLDGEGVPESVGVCVRHVRDHAQSLDGATHIFSASVHVTVSSPEEILRVLRGKCLKGGYRVRMQENLDRRASLLRP